jgi:hypothetical protein
MKKIHLTFPTQSLPKRFDYDATKPANTGRSRQDGGPAPNAEQQRLDEARDESVPWKKWGPYLSERQWGTVREDYSENGNAWDYFSHDQARSRAYHGARTDWPASPTTSQRLCFALALWNGKDPILKERLFGLTNSEGNHGEDVKEYYLLSRQHADALLHEVPLQVSPGRLSVHQLSW